VLADCIPCIDWHYLHAVKAGASQEELSEALAISMAVISGSKRAKYSSVVSKLEEHCKK
jgi:alkylhydroperoxidase/carboxymuconolactone decarboxylase family protein YurZ